MKAPAGFSLAGVLAGTDWVPTWRTHYGVPVTYASLQSKRALGEIEIREIRDRTKVHVFVKKVK